MKKLHHITVDLAQQRREIKIGEPVLKTINGLEMLILPHGEAIALSQISRFNSIVFQDGGDRLCVR